MFSNTSEHYDLLIDRMINKILEYLRGKNQTKDTREREQKDWKKPTGKSLDYLARVK